MKLKLTIHQMAAMWWLATGAVIFIPLLPLATKPDAGVKAWAIVASVTAIIALAPIALLAPPIRRWFCWTDALTQHEHKLLIARNFKAFGEAARAGAYVQRVKPYIMRIMGLLLASTAAAACLPESAYIWRLGLNAIGWYCCGVLLMLNATVLLTLIQRK
jgi:hypothetical protein